MMLKNNPDKDITHEIACHINAVMELLGIEVTDSNKETPLRVAKMYNTELFKNRSEESIKELDVRMTTFDNEDYTNGIIEMSGIKFSSVCEHHWLPFMGYVNVKYLPSKKIIGLSKIPRVVEFFSKKPQLQEKLTGEIGKYLVKLLDPKYLKVEVVATHTCIMCRGANSDCDTRTIFNYANPDNFSTKEVIDIDYFGKRVGE